MSSAYARPAVHRSWWRELPTVAQQAGGPQLTQAAVDATERRFDRPIGKLLDQRGRRAGVRQLTEFRDNVFEAYLEASLHSAGLPRPARQEARAAGADARAEAGLRTGLVTLRAMASLDSVIWRSGLAGLAPGIERIDGNPRCDPRCLLHAAAASELVEQLAADGPEQAFEALNRPDGGWHAAARLAGATEQQAPAVAAAMRQQYRAVDDIDLEARRIDPRRTWVTRNKSRDQVGKLGDAPRLAQAIARQAIEAGRAVIDRQPDPGPESGPDQQQVYDPRVGLDEFGSTSAPQAGTDAGTPTAYGQGRGHVERNW